MKQNWEKWGVLVVIILAILTAFGVGIRGVMQGEINADSIMSLDNRTHDDIEEVKASLKEAEDDIEENEDRAEQYRLQVSNIQIMQTHTVGLLNEIKDEIKKEHQ